MRLIATTDHAGNVTARYACDSCGTDRGFTGHEQLDDIGLVHMNGRIFDANLGRFLQADPMIEAPNNLQSYNRYAYLWNNPLNGTDPTGFCFICDPWKSTSDTVQHWSDVASNDQNFKLVASIAVAYYLGGATGLEFFGGGFAQAATAGFVSGAISTGNMEGALQGSFSAVAFYGAGQLIGGAYTDGFKLTGGEAIAVHGVVGCVTSAVGGGKCSSGAMSAAFSKAATVSGFVGEDAISGTITSAVIGGTASVLGGGTFENGARTAAFGYLFNHCQSVGCVRELQSKITGFLHGLSGPLPKAAVYFGFGGAGTGGPFNLTADTGIAVDTRGIVCLQTTSCGGAGATMDIGGGLGVVVQVQQGSLTVGTQSTEGLAWMGGKGLFGEGQLQKGDDGFQFGRTMVGVGGTASGGPKTGVAGATPLSCQTLTVTCSRGD